MTLLSLNQVTAFYGVSQALFGVDLSIEQGQVLALLGRNGMGKSTTIKTICRMLPHHSGQIVFNDQDLAAVPSHKAAQLGLGLVPEGRRCFPNLSVHENLMAAVTDGFWNLNRVEALFPRLAERRRQLAVSLSGGEQQMLAIGRALMTNPTLLLLDEATEGLAPIVRQEIWAAISAVKEDTGLTILIVDKSIKELSSIADRAVILHAGKSVWQGEWSGLDKHTRDTYLGV